MENFKHLSIDEKIILQDLLISDFFKKKNEKPNLSKIAKYMKRSKNTICYELKYYGQIKRYHPVKHKRDILKNGLNAENMQVWHFNR